MKLSTIIEWLPVWYESEKAMYLRSAPGRGKTSICKEAPKILGKFYNKNFGFMHLNAANINPLDLYGYGLPKHDKEGPAHMVFSLPFFFKTLEGKFLWEYDGGIILIDEADKGDLDIKKIAADAALIKRFGMHDLPKGWVVWFAGNRAEDRSGSTKELDHMINRISYVDVTDDPAGWQVWAEANNITEITISFAMTHTPVVWSELPAKQRSYCSPRSLVSWDDILRTTLRLRYGNDINKLVIDDTLQELCAGTIGAPEAAQYFETLQLAKEMPKYADIISNPTGVRVPERADAQMLVCYNLAKQVSKDDAASVIKYVDRMNKDFAATFVKRATDRDHKLLTASPAFARWTMANSQLLSVINGVQ